MDREGAAGIYDLRLTSGNLRAHQVHPCSDLYSLSLASSPGSHNDLPYFSFKRGLVECRKLALVIKFSLCIMEKCALVRLKTLGRSDLEVMAKAIDIPVFVLTTEVTTNHTGKPKPSFWPRLDRDWPNPKQVACHFVDYHFLSIWHVTCWPLGLANAA